MVRTPLYIKIYRDRYMNMISSVYLERIEPSTSVQNQPFVLYLGSLTTSKWFCQFPAAPTTSLSTRIQIRNHPISQDLGFAILWYYMLQLHIAEREREREDESFIWLGQDVRIFSIRILSGLSFESYEIVKIWIIYLYDQQFGLIGAMDYPY